MTQSFSPALASNAVTATVQMYASIMMDADMREKMLLAQILQLQAKLNRATTALKDNGIVLPEV
jgi:hypothetical protein